jgi:DNA-binding NarL/FixJ family response regulator
MKSTSRLLGRQLPTPLPRISGGLGRSEINTELDNAPASAVLEVIVADDHPLFLDALERVLSLQPDIRVIARCRDGVEVLLAISECRADLLLLDIRMPRKDGFAVLRDIKEAGEDIPVVVLSGHLADEDVIELLRLGIRGLVPKQVPAETLIQCLREVHAGGRWFDPICLARVADTLVRRDAGAGEGLKALTPREVEIVRKVATGLRNRAIARELCVTEGTVKIHLHNIYEKLEVAGRFALMHWARERDLFSDQPPGRSVSDDKSIRT